MTEGVGQDGNVAKMMDNIRIQKLIRAVDELVAWSFVMDEKDVILSELEKCVDEAEKELLRASDAVEDQQRRCALVQVHRSTKQERKIPQSARGSDHKLEELWKSKGEAFKRQYELHLTTYKRLFDELLEEELQRLNGTTTSAGDLRRPPEDVCGSSSMTEISISASPAAGGNCSDGADSDAAGAIA
ncbi:uncharacterized protein TEOVI_000432000 [Trypanosoma equiperdum]|uniref:Uncharacterized protein n=3 Tax=Trypanozoon TaxID=39700 RepID=Q383T5_TRYB2|nr:hypothetical protein, conserved [Trypanosoma brucei brucei TREU927]EAN79946.1 hypothetical protein, conserved [Trypanosoma brucei brucei TREU927]RHW68383.1 hypothetical protein DPX39_110070800 [Trypanosoma brucei equiperdum]SCU72742.1 hypothetical protein, conserved [Trypanosoma equiperdum]